MTFAALIVHVEYEPDRTCSMRFEPVTGKPFTLQVDNPPPMRVRGDLREAVGTRVIVDEKFVYIRGKAWATRMGSKKIVLKAK